MKTVDVLTRAKNRISDPKHWTQEHSARDTLGHPTLFYAKDATCWCSVGAVAKAHGKPLGTAHHFSTELLDKAAHELGYKDAIRLNDESNHGTVMQMFDLAIGLAKEKEKVKNA